MNSRTNQRGNLAGKVLRSNLNNKVTKTAATSASDTSVATDTSKVKSSLVAKKPIQTLNYMKTTERSVESTKRLLSKNVPLSTPASKTSSVATSKTRTSTSVPTGQLKKVPLSTPTNKTSTVATSGPPKRVPQTSSVVTKVEKRDANDKKAEETKKEVVKVETTEESIANYINENIKDFKPVPFQCDITRIRKYEHNYPEIDKRARNTPKSEESSPEKLAQYLTSPYNTVEEKARSLFIWVTNNIDYDVEGLYSGRAHNSSQSSWESRTAVCSGYSDLLKRMCDCCNIECVTISGCSKGAGYVVGASVSSGHAWSAVKTEDGEYRLIEPTWGSGHISPSSTSKWGQAFERKFNDRYFFMSPYEFISEHFPDESKWQLLPQIVSKEEFEKRAAIKVNGFNCGLTCISHPYGLNMLNESNICDMVLKVFPGTESMINLIDENGVFLWDAINVRYSEKKDFIYARICFPNKGVKYSVRVFVGPKGSEEWGLEQTFTVSPEAEFDDRGVPTMYSDFSDQKLSLVSPLFGKLSRNTTYTFEIQTNGSPVDLMITGTSSGVVMQSHKGGSGNFKCSFTTGAEPNVIVYGRTDPNANYAGFLVYKVG